MASWLDFISSTLGSSLGLPGLGTQAQAAPNAAGQDINTHIKGCRNGNQKHRPVKAIVPDNVSRRKAETKNAYEARKFSSEFGSAARVVSISRNPKTSKKKKAPIGPQRIATDKIFNSHCITIIVKYH